MGEIVKKNEKPEALKGLRFLFNGHFFSGKIILTGLAVTQVIATIHVYLSNTGLFHSLDNLVKAGYLVVPNSNVINTLPEFGPAFYGGLFFTLSTGALLSLLGLVSALMWDRLFKRKKILLIPFLIVWAGLTGEANIRGIVPSITAYFLFIPSIVFMAALRWMPPVHHKNTGYRFTIFNLIPFLLTVIIWILSINSGIFTNIRDHLLLSNSPGTKINDFYYQYTLYPAEAIKSLDQKTIRTYRVKNLSKNNTTDQIKKRLAGFDFLEITGNTAADLTIDEKDNSLIFSNKGRIILTTPAENFLAFTQKTLMEISIRADMLDFFRRFTFISLMTGSPALVYIFFYSMLRYILVLFIDYRNACTVSLYLCLAATVLTSVFLNNISAKQIDEKNLSEALRSEDWHKRVMALRLIDEKKLDISHIVNYQEMMESPCIPVRYWLAKVLETGRDPEGNRALLKLMNDPCPNVVCMAYYSLGQRGKKSTVSIILKSIRLSDHWYEQWYAYRALKALGWKQTILK